MGVNIVRQIVIKNRLKCPKAENQIHLYSGSLDCLVTASSGVSEFPQNEFIVYFVEKAPIYDQCIVGLEIAHIGLTVLNTSLLHQLIGLSYIIIMII